MSKTPLFGRLATLDLTRPNFLIFSHLPSLNTLKRFRFESRLRWVFVLGVGLVGLTVARLHAEELFIVSRPVEVIDIPTADLVDQYGYRAAFRFGGEGNLQVKAMYGLFNRLQFGFGLDGEHVLGTEDGRLNQPSINIKFKLFQGDRVLPALSLGYDGQGYEFNKTLDEYEQREKGLYLVATHEFFFPNLLIHVGGNIFDFEEGDSTRGFWGMSYDYQKIFGLLFEWDHATEYDERRINFGLRYYVTPVFTVDAIGRNVPKYYGSSSRETERVVRLVYIGSF